MFPVISFTVSSPRYSCRCSRHRVCLSHLWQVLPEAGYDAQPHVPGSRLQESCCRPHHRISMCDLFSAIPYFCASLSASHTWFESLPSWLPSSHAPSGTNRDQTGMDRCRSDTREEAFACSSCFSVARMTSPCVFLFLILGFQERPS